MAMKVSHCPDCKGKGWYNPWGKPYEEECENCDGTGHIVEDD